VSAVWCDRGSGFTEANEAMTADESEQEETETTEFVCSVYSVCSCSALRSMANADTVNLDDDEFALIELRVGICEKPQAHAATGVSKSAKSRA